MSSLKQSLSASLNRPTTPIKRYSRGSLSYSYLQGATAQSDAFEQYFEPLLTELADSFEDLAENFQLLNAVNDELDSFNTNFAAFLYGLKMNAYTTDFTECPVKLNFDLDAERQRKAREQAQAQASASVGSSEESEEEQVAEDDGVGETTYQSFGHGHTSFAPTSRGGSTVRGTRGRGRGRGGTSKAAARKKEQAMDWVMQVIGTLEIKYREEQPFRAEMEQILLILRQHPQGLYIPDMVKKSSPPIQSHRVNAALISLTRSRHVLKVATGQGLMFRLDPSRHPV